MSHTRMPRSNPLARLVVSALTVVALTGPMPAAAQSMSAADVASDPEVQAQIDLFSAWMEGQIEIRGLPGAVVGVR